MAVVDRVYAQLVRRNGGSSWLADALAAAARWKASQLHRPGVHKGGV